MQVYALPLASSSVSRARTPATKVKQLMRQAKPPMSNMKERDPPGRRLPEIKPLERRPPEGPAG